MPKAEEGSQPEWCEPDLAPRRGIGLTRRWTVKRCESDGYLSGHIGLTAGSMDLGRAGLETNRVAGWENLCSSNGGPTVLRS